MFRARKKKNQPTVRKTTATPTTTEPAGGLDAQVTVAKKKKKKKKKQVLSFASDNDDDDDRAPRKKSSGFGVSTTALKAKSEDAPPSTDDGSKYSTEQLNQLKQLTFQNGPPPKPKGEHVRDADTDVDLGNTTGDLTNTTLNDDDPSNTTNDQTNPVADPTSDNAYDLEILHKRAQQIKLAKQHKNASLLGYGEGDGEEPFFSSSDRQPRSPRTRASPDEFIPLSSSPRTRVPPDSFGAPSDDSKQTTTNSNVHDQELWEDEHIARGTAGRSLHQHTVPAPGQSSKFASYENVFKDLHAQLEEIKSRQHLHERQIVRIQADKAHIVKDEDAAVAALTRLSSRYDFFQDMRSHINTLCSCLQEKEQLIVQVEDSVFKIWSKRYQTRHGWRMLGAGDEIEFAEQNQQLASRGDNGHFPARFLVSSTTQAPSAVDDLGRDRRFLQAKETEKRRATRDARRSSACGASAPSPWLFQASHDDDPDEVASMHTQLDRVQQARNMVFDDVVDTLSSLDAVLDKFSTFRKTYPDEYDKSFVGHSLPELVGVFARYEMLPWNPLTSAAQEGHFAWETSLLRAHGGTDEMLRDPESEDAALQNCSLVVYRDVVFPLLFEFVNHCWDPVDVAETVNLVSWMSKIERRCANVTTLRDLFRGGILKRLVERFLEVEQDIAIPIPAETREIRSETTRFCLVQFVMSLMLVRSLLRCKMLCTDTTTNASWDQAVVVGLEKQTKLIKYVHRPSGQAAFASQPLDAVIELAKQVYTELARDFAPSLETGSPVSRKLYVVHELLRMETTETSMDGRPK